MYDLLVDLGAPIERMIADEWTVAQLKGQQFAHIRSLFPQFWKVGKLTIKERKKAKNTGREGGWRYSDGGWSECMSVCLPLPSYCPFHFIPDASKDGHFEESHTQNDLFKLLAKSSLEK